MFFFEIGTKILTLLLFISWIILFYLFSIWTASQPGDPKDYRVGFMLSSFTVFKYFFISFLVFSLISLLISYFSK